MKKILTSTITLILGVLLLSSCVKDSNCKTCKQNEYINGAFTREITSVEACTEDEINTFETAEPVTINGKTTKYVCE